MRGGDRTGPAGKGPMTGRALGYTAMNIRRPALSTLFKEEVTVVVAAVGDIAMDTTRQECRVGNEQKWDGLPPLRQNRS